MNLLCVGGPKHGEFMAVDDSHSGPVDAIEYQGQSSLFGDMRFTITRYFREMLRFRGEDDRYGEFQIYGRYFWLHETVAGQSNELREEQVKDALLRCFMTSEPDCTRRYDRNGYLRGES